MVGSTAPSRKPRTSGKPELHKISSAQRDAARDISKAKGADLDKALKNLVSTGDVRKSKSTNNLDTSFQK